ncbi:hypothetical protein QLH32_00610 [Acinetobacter corruptisaponis]|uniref:Uncharacterized protein n=1 Tax=Acinetobacter corruptisaponis TaxID=3045147 RepID=A0ABY8S2S7_9GAMM|nr:hypothetical protein [Acinetobacter sp. KCTC 92772]WHP06017.1 hypothetical protein QLH32_00610 [Acinetobacter sp. KCTC 92772]
MPQFLKLAEKIYFKVKTSKGFTDEPVEDLNNLMIELRKEIKKTDFKLLYNYINFEELLMNSGRLSINFDLSILPKSKNSDEYILWLAGFIQKITYYDKKDMTCQKSKVVLPTYYYDDSGNIVNKSDNKGEEIVEYFKSQEAIP